jgi:phosphonopyruvate decarboxylase
MNTPHEQLAAEQRHELLEGELLERFKDEFGTDFVTGLPCGELREFIRQSQLDPSITHMPTTNEREAIGVATGAWLGGKRPALYMQNSGLFLASNDIGSLMIPSKIDATFAISWRGGLGETATQHFVTGTNTPLLLDGFGFEKTTQPSRESIHDIKLRQDQSHMPAAVLIRRQKYNLPPEPLDIDTVERPVSQRESLETPDGSLSREEALATIVNQTDNRIPTISSTGLISRSLFHHFDNDNHFYNAGGFGVTSAIALGVASAQPDIPVLAIEGDGSVLTNPGSLNLIGNYQPKNLIHIVLNNQALVSCSHEQTIGNHLIADLAELNGYRAVFTVNDTSGLETAVSQALANLGSGPQFIHAHIDTSGERAFKRPLDMDVTAQRFRDYVASFDV